MKQTLIIALLLLTHTLFSQEESSTLPVDPGTNKVAFAKVVETPGVSSKDLFGSARKFILTKNTPSNPFTIKYENLQEGSLIAEGTFTLPADRFKYVVRFSITIATKNGKYKYSFTDLIVQYHTNATSSHGGYGGWGSSSHKAAETLEYSVETFYPARLENKRKPVIKYYEEIDESSFVFINKELKSLTSALKQSMASKDNW